MENKYVLLPANDAVQNWFEENINKECSASSAVYKFIQWLESMQGTRQPGAWVKASERLPGLKKPVKWREDGRELKMQEVWYMILDSNTRELERCEWYDESAPEYPAEQPGREVAIEDLKAKGEKLALELRRCSGSMRVHPDYVSGNNIEFIDRVSGAEEALQEWSGEKEGKKQC